VEDRDNFFVQDQENNSYHMTKENSKQDYFEIEKIENTSR